MANAAATHAVVDIVGYFGPAVINGGTPPPGPQGPPGLQGPVGPTGPQGPMGAQGPTGATGPQGPPGPTGLQGPTGPPGPKGLTGATGPQGNTGATGPQGATGSQGLAGPSVTTSKVCSSDVSPSTFCSQICARVVAGIGPTTGDCNVSSDGGPCSATGCQGIQCDRTRYAICCVCRP
jgi:hypothetical protein